MNLNKYEIDDLIDRLQKGETIPDDFKYKLFPVKQKEYELVYGGKMRREDILANEDGVFPVPLQVKKFSTETVSNGKTVGEILLHLVTTCNSSKQFTRTKAL